MSSTYQYTLQGYINTDWSALYLDSTLFPVNNSKTTSTTAASNGFPTYITNGTGGYPYQGTIQQISIYDTNGNQIQYRDNNGYKYYLSATVLVKSASPLENTKNDTWTGSNITTITLWGQYFGPDYVDGSNAVTQGGTPVSTAVTPSSTNTAYTDYGYYAIWVPTTSANTEYIPIGNPAFTYTTSTSGTSSLQCSTYQQCTGNANGGLVANPGNNGATMTYTGSNLVNGYTDSGGQTYNVTGTSTMIQANDLDAAAGDTNIFSNINNVSPTYSSQSSTYTDTTYYKFFVAKSYYYNYSGVAPNTIITAASASFLFNITTN